MASVLALMIRRANKSAKKDLVCEHSNVVLYILTFEAKLQIYRPYLKAGKSEEVTSDINEK